MKKTLLFTLSIICYVFCIGLSASTSDFPPEAGITQMGDSSTLLTLHDSPQAEPLTGTSSMETTMERLQTFKQDTRWFLRRSYFTFLCYLPTILFICYLLLPVAMAVGEWAMSNPQKCDDCFRYHKTLHKLDSLGVENSPRPWLAYKHEYCDIGQGNSGIIDCPLGLFDTCKASLSSTAYQLREVLKEGGAFDTAPRSKLLDSTLTSIARLCCTQDSSATTCSDDQLAGLSCSASGYRVSCKLPPNPLDDL